MLGLPLPKHNGREGFGGGGKSLARREMNKMKMEGSMMSSMNRMGTLASLNSQKNNMLVPVKKTYQPPSPIKAQQLNYYDPSHSP